VAGSEAALNRPGGPLPGIPVWEDLGWEVLFSAELLEIRPQPLDAADERHGR
jgi:hypothetical protein